MADPRPVIALSATFEDGRTIRRNSRREYDAAWRFKVRLSDGSFNGNTGFAADAAAAQKAAHAEASYMLRSYRSKGVRAELATVEIVGVERSANG